MRKCASLNLKKMRKTQSSKINLYELRNMGEQINATFDFVKENWRLWIKSHLLLVLVPSVMVAYFFSEPLRSLIAPEYIDPDDLYALSQHDSFLENHGYAFLVLGGLGLSLSITVSMTLLKFYTKRLKGLEGIRFKDLLLEMLSCSLRMVGIVALFILVVTPAFFLMSIIGVLVPFIGQFAAFGFILPALMLPAVVEFERGNNIITSIKRCYHLGMQQWIQFVFQGVVMVTIVLIADGTLFWPWWIFSEIGVEMFGDLSFMSTLDFIVEIVLTIANVFVVFLSLSCFFIFQAYHYGSMLVYCDEESLVEKIENFENL